MIKVFSYQRCLKLKYSSMLTLIPVSVIIMLEILLKLRDSDTYPPTLNCPFKLVLLNHSV